MHSVETKLEINMFTSSEKALKIHTNCLVMFKCLDSYGYVLNCQVLKILGYFHGCTLLVVNSIRGVL